MTMAHATAFESCLRRPEAKEGDTVWLTVIDGQLLPAILSCVEKWELANFPETVTVDTFPFSPRIESHKLQEWIFEEISKVYGGEIEVPNA